MDFLQAEGEEFSSLDEVTEHIQSTASLSKIDGDLSVIGSISDFDSTDNLVESTESHFSIEQRMGNLLLLNSLHLDVPYYVYLSDEFPIWFTTGRKTEDMPETIDEYLKSDRDIGRMWISKTEMENLRQRVVQNYPDVLMPYFTASRSKHSEIPANRRPKYERTFQYYGKDGLETFNELKYEYGVLPTNLKFQKANNFKFRVTTRGVFTIKNGGLGEVLTVIEDSIDRLQEVKEAIDASGFKRMQNQFASGQTIPESRPWAVQLDSEITQEDVERFEGEELEDWEFTLGKLDASFEGDTAQLKAELIDERTFGKTILRSHEDSIRIYPREHTGIDQSVRVFEFINDQLDPNSYATRVA
ncbi:hypothetical protein ACLI4Z_09250 [Natrialbaceae archaeon A-arb3/5]